jgi:hypothetical protein
MSFGVTMELSPNLKRMINQSEGNVKELISNTLLQVALKVEHVIKEPGFAPRDKGYLAARHSTNMRKNALTAYITVNANYALYIIYGHKTPIAISQGRGWHSEKQRRWWFWTLKEKYGGEYTLKTKDYYVPPNNYPHRALVAVAQSGDIVTIIRDSFIRHYVGKA